MTEGEHVDNLCDVCRKSKAVRKIYINLKVIIEKIEKFGGDSLIEFLAKDALVALENKCQD